MALIDVVGIGVSLAGSVVAVVVGEVPMRFERMVSGGEIVLILQE